MINTVKQGSRDRIPADTTTKKKRNNLIGNKLQLLSTYQATIFVLSQFVLSQVLLATSLYVVSTVLTLRIVFSGHCELIVLLCQELLALSKQRAKKKFALTHILRILYNTPHGYNKNFAEEPGNKALSRSTQISSRQRDEEKAG
jgi:hypothetical protein